MSKFALSILICCFSLFAQSQELKVIQAVESQLLKDYEQLVSAQIMTRTDSLAPKFRNQLAGFLQNEGTYNYPFEKLSQYIRITSAASAPFRIFGYDEFTGGHWHEMINIAQIRLPDGRVITEFLNTANSLSLGNYNDAIVYAIHPWGEDKDGHPLFLFLGWGSHGPNHKFESAELYSFNGVHLEPLTDIYFNGKEYVNELATDAPRSADISLQVDEDAFTVSMMHFKETESGWMQSRNPTVYSWNGSTFTVE